MFGPSFPGGPPPMGPPGSSVGSYPLDPHTYRDPVTGKVYTVESTLEADGSINRLIFDEQGHVVGGGTVPPTRGDW